jgi:hypothetical protein
MRILIQCTRIGLAVLPTWLVVKNHTPVEYVKSEDTFDSSRDEEQPIPQESHDIGKASLAVGTNEVTK